MCRLRSRSTRVSLIGLAVPSVWQFGGYAVILFLYSSKPLAISLISVLICGASHRLQRPDRRHRNQRRQNADDRDHDQELDERERCARMRDARMQDARLRCLRSCSFMLSVPYS